MIGIYKIVNKINGKVYIGQSINIEKRFYEHRRGLSKKKKYINIYLQRAWKKYGSENFDFKIIEECERNKLNERECFWISQYKNNCYNIELNPNVTPFNDETKKKMSEKAKKKYETKNIRKMLKLSGFYRKENKDKQSSEYTL
jgi:group I intron endonuclease